jgi:DHA1 family multidrug resistance protein B-like MFS transporter
MSSSTARNLILYTTVSSIWGVIFGFIGPFYVLWIDKLSGGMEKLGIAFAIMVLLQSLTTYMAGHYSDKLGRKPFLIITSYVDAGVLILFTVITKTSHVYILQGILGITNGVHGTIRTSLLGDLTVKEKRGGVVGKFSAIVSLASAIGLALSGYLVKFYGIEFLFYLSAIVVAVSTSLLFFIKEER